MKTKQDAASHAALFVLLLMLAGCGRHQSIQGHWSGSKARQPSYSCTLSITGNQLEYRGADSNDWARGTFVLNEKAKPMEMDFTILEPASESNHMIRVIYEIKKGKLNTAISSLQRPTDFSLNGPGEVYTFTRD